jgi:hypothetical protein
MTKLSDWEHRVYKVLDEFEHAPFAYGRRDCCQFVAACLLAQTGVDYSSKFGQYNSKEGALQFIAQYGSLQNVMSSAISQQPIAGNKAQKGDIVYAELVGEQFRTPTLGLCAGDYLIFVGKAGLVGRDLSAAICAWRIG